MEFANGYYACTSDEERVIVAFYVRGNRVFANLPRQDAIWRRAISNLHDLSQYRYEGNLKYVKPEREDAWLDHLGIEPCTIWSD